MSESVEQAAPTLEPGARVCHRYVDDLAGTVERVTGDYVRVKWDHYGLAVSALGTLADLQRSDFLVRLPA